ncbi:hypothetical protein ScPMuIL_005552 [Solemya velum]
MVASCKDKENTEKNKKEKKKKSKEKGYVKAQIALLEAHEPPAKPLKKTRPSMNHIDESGYGKYKKANRRQDEKDGCFGCLRTSLHCYNIIVLILGIGVLAVGIWLLVTEFSAREISVLVNSHLFEIATYFMIAGGGAIALLAFCGCCGTMREDKCVLAFYGVTLSLVFLALIIGAILAFVFKGEMVKSVQDHFMNTITNNYGVETRTNSRNRLITEAWDSMQASLECCGAHGNENATTSWASYKTKSQWYHNQEDRTPFVPDSCCAEDGDLSICTGQTDIRGPPAFGPEIESSYIRNDNLHKNGCYDKAIVYLKTHAVILGTVAASVPIFLVIGIVIVFCLCVRVKGVDDDYDGDEVDV